MVEAVDVKKLSENLVPVRSSEIVRPTRVVWRYKSNQFLTSRVFPTAERAWAFAAEQDSVVVVQDVHERPPKQDSRVHHAFVNFPNNVPSAEQILRTKTKKRQVK